MAQVRDGASRTPSVERCHQPARRVGGENERREARRRRMDGRERWSLFYPAASETLSPAPGRPRADRGDASTRRRTRPTGARMASTRGGGRTGRARGRQTWHARGAKDPTARMSTAALDGMESTERRVCTKPTHSWRSLASIFERVVDSRRHHSRAPRRSPDVCSPRERVQALAAARAADARERERAADARAHAVHRGRRRGGLQRQGPAQARRRPRGRRRRGVGGARSPPRGRTATTTTAPGARRSRRRSPPQTERGAIAGDARTRCALRRRVRRDDVALLGCNPHCVPCVEIWCPAREVVPDVQGAVRRMALRRGGAVRSGRGRGREEEEEEEGRDESDGSIGCPRPPGRGCRRGRRGRWRST